MGDRSKGGALFAKSAPFLVSLSRASRGSRKLSHCMFSVQQRQRCTMFMKPLFI